MTYTLSQLTYKVARELGICKDGVATGGSVTTIVDTVDRTEADDFWNGGSAWILRDAAGAGAAPEGEHNYITDFTASSDTITCRNAFSTAVASGDRYAVAYKYVPLDIIVQKINSALVDLGPQLYVYSSLSTASNKTEYDLPVAQKLDVRKVLIQTNLNDSDNNQYKELFNWYQIPGDAGAVDTLVFREQPHQPYTLKIYFTAFPPDLNTGTAKLLEHISVERVVYPAIRDCFQYRKDNTGWTQWDDQIAKWENRVETLRVRNPQRFPVKPGNILIARQPQRGRSVSQGYGSTVMLWDDTLAMEWG